MSPTRWPSGAPTMDLIMKKLVQCIGWMVLPLAVTGVAADDGWVDLFNGKDLTGWVQHGGKAKYSVQDGVLVGATVTNTGNSFLCTEKDYGDFILELDFKANPLLNSGVQIRSECFPVARTLTIAGKEIKVAADRVHGYQCEIDMDPVKKRWWTAGIYDEARRNWLYPGTLGGQAAAFTAQGAKVSKPDEWNHLRIEAIGPAIKTYLNGALRASIVDDLTPRGLIGLQVHTIGKDTSRQGIQVQFKNVRLKAITRTGAGTDTAASSTLSAEEKAAGWQLLWDGKSGDGWRSAKSENFPSHGWTMRDGVLTVHENGGEESAGGGDIITRKRFANFELAADFKTTPGCNSGIKLFVQPSISPIDKKTGKPAGVGSAIGLEFQILDDARHPDAKLGRDGNRTIGSLYDLIPAPKDKKVLPIGEWSHARILSQGKHVEFWLNGQKTVEFERGSPEFRAVVAQSKFKDIPEFGEWSDGHILLQEHGNEVSFRNVKIRPLPVN